MLTRLGDDGRTVAEPDDDVRGRTVVDVDGEDLGTVADLLVDTGEGRVRMLDLATGGVLGIGRTHSYVPVEAVTAVEDERVVVDLTRERLAGAPEYDPDLADRVDDASMLYGYYGYPMLWVSGHVVPPEPARRGPGAP